MREITKRTFKIALLLSQYNHIQAITLLSLFIQTEKQLNTRPMPYKDDLTFHLIVQNKYMQGNDGVIKEIMLVSQE